MAKENDIKKDPPKLPTPPKPPADRLIREGEIPKPPKPRSK